MPAAIDEQTAKARTMDKLILTLPLPPKELSPNARLHYQAKAKVTRRYRRDCGWNGLAELMNWEDNDAWRPTRVRLTETYRIAGKRKYDVRNLFAAFKAGEDGLVDAGIIPGDDDSVLEHGAPKIERVASKKDEGILVVIEAVV